MKIERKSPAGPSSVARAPRRGSTGTETFQVPQTAGGSSETAAMTGLSGATAPGAVVMAQVDDAPDRRRQHNANRAGDMLDRLDELRLGLLEGRLSSGVLNRLSEQLASHREQENDPQAAEMLDAIDLRVAVELAKLRR
ncbi:MULTISPECIES: flagellar assembly protein FliX [unclassified Minwuia]|uniref:flagellar assembly protein FliX n=1 Tax=unclassified Minwuia TaxID=2618799 RepID=UPI00247A12BC|nr:MULTISPECIES: flagellar assembly protein FliX [unclassified Minwuia]